MDEASEIEKVDGVEEVEHNHRTAAELLDNAAPLFGSDRERLDHDEKQFPLEMYANIVKDITGAVSLYESCVAQEIANKKESERLRLVRLEEERKREAKRARELKMVEEEAARVRTKAQNMVDPAMKKLAALKATIELQGLGITNIYTMSGIQQLLLLQVLQFQRPHAVSVVKV